MYIQVPTIQLSRSCIPSYEEVSAAHLSRSHLQSLVEGRGFGSEIRDQKNVVITTNDGQHIKIMAQVSAATGDSLAGLASPPGTGDKGVLILLEGWVDGTGKTLHFHRRTFMSVVKTPRLMEALNTAGHCGSDESINVHVIYRCETDPSTQQGCE